MKPSTCRDCGSLRVITRDAIGRPRERCPHCQGIAPPSTNTGVREHLHNQSAMSSADLAWPMPGAAHNNSFEALARQFTSSYSAAPATCYRCGAALARSRGRGRPRKYCEDTRECASRALSNPRAHSER